MDENMDENIDETNIDNSDNSIQKNEEHRIKHR